MAITILTPASLRVSRPVDGGQAGLRQQILACAWSTTDLTGTIPVQLTKVTNVVVVPAGTANSPTITDYQGRALSASVSATSDFTFRMPRTGTITGVSFDTSASISASDSTYWTFGLLNKTAATTVVDNTTAANSTKATGGSGTTAFTSFPLTLSTGVAVTAADLYQLNVTKTSTPAAITGFSLWFSYTYTGTPDERMQWTDTRTADGSYNTSGVISLSRSATSVLSARKFDILVYGYN